MTTITSSLSQAAEQAARVNQSSSAATSGSGTASAGASTTGANALQSLGSNFNNFLSLLTTQLKNQDPTSPMDTDQFTQELVQFTGVQQSVATNTNLSQLISLTQGSEVLQSSQVVGEKATVNATQIALQNGTGGITFNVSQAEPVQIAIVNSAGQTILNGTVNAQAGNNSWSWNGKDGNGNTVPDGAYGIALETGSSSGSATSVPFSVVGTATGLTNSSSGMTLDMGALAVPLSSVQSISKQ